MKNELQLAAAAATLKVAQRTLSVGKDRRRVVAANRLEKFKVAWEGKGT